MFLGAVLETPIFDNLGNLIYCLDPGKADEMQRDHAIAFLLYDARSVDPSYLHKTRTWKIPTDLEMSF